jgi:uroporphyrinogen decarboxylase
MRQAGRYMSEYRDLRARHSFLELCKQPDLAAEVTLYAARRLGVDAAILFADILLIVECLGLKLSFNKGEGPCIEAPVRELSDLKRLRPVQAEELDYVYQAVSLIRKELAPEVALIGFAGAPFTVASYCIEGGSSRELLNTKLVMLSQPEVWHSLMSNLAEGTAAYLNAQIKAGADSIQLFDSWVGCLSPELYRRFVFPYTASIFKALPPEIPKIHFGTRTALLLKDMREVGADVVGVDFSTPLDWARQQLGATPVQGNLDPAYLLADRASLDGAIRSTLEAGGRAGHIFNLGHGIVPQTPVDNVIYLVERVRELSAAESL